MTTATIPLHRRSSRKFAALLLALFTALALYRIATSLRIPSSGTPGSGGSGGTGGAATGGGG